MLASWGMSLDCADRVELAEFYLQLLGGRVLWHTERSVGAKVPGVLLIGQRVADYRPPRRPGASVALLDLTAGNQLEEPAHRAVAVRERRRSTARPPWRSARPGWTPVLRQHRGFTAGAARWASAAGGATPPNISPPTRTEVAVQHCLGNTGRVSYVDVLILSHLAGRPSHGYELRQRVGAITGFALHNNSLYPALRRFEEAGAVTKTAQAQEGRPPRHVYAITETGRELLHDMLAELSIEQAGDDTEFLARLGQFEYLSPDERCAVLDARLTALGARVEHLSGLAALSGRHSWGAMVVEELVRRTAAERSWLERLRALGGELPAPGGTGS